MRMFKRGCVALILISASACGGNDTPTSPSTAPRNVTMTFNGLTGGGTSVAIYGESGFSVSASVGSWVALTTRAVSTILRQPGSAIYCSDSTVRMSPVD
jgi:hypothetical protein